MSTARRLRTRSQGANVTLEPTDWRLLPSEAPLPRNVHGRWHLPGAQQTTRPLQDWMLIVHHPADTQQTPRDQWVSDDTVGFFAVFLGGTALELLPGNTAASIRMDRTLSPQERRDIAGGEGYFAEIARCGHWLSSYDDAQCRRRLASVIVPEHFPNVLSTPASRDVAAADVVHRMRAEWGMMDAGIALGYLHALPMNIDMDLKKKVFHTVCSSIVAPETNPAQQLALGEALNRWRGIKATPTQACSAAALVVLANDDLPPELHQGAEDLLVSLAT